KTYVAGTSYDLRKAQVLADTTAGKTKSVAIATTGSLVPQALQAAKDLESKGVGAVVVNCACVNPAMWRWFPPSRMWMCIPCLAVKKPTL
ncbi:transketolase C-terminal domain-containing protein, partial [Escherichia coli]|uniref:transketolase C-terminal domain-containing protein n=1 Tax=Escherichia coli TaxID=562 RepID=UPI0010FFFB0E